jgi:hypothetical protein
MVFQYVKKNIFSKYFSLISIPIIKYLSKTWKYILTEYIIYSVNIVSHKKVNILYCRQHMSIAVKA